MTETGILELVEKALKSPWDRMPGVGFTSRASVREMTRGGSDRRFYRVSEEGLTAMVMVQPGGGPEFDRFVRIGDFLRESGIAVPNFYFIDGVGVAVMEDLGDMHLVDALDGADPQAELAFYRDCMDIIFRLQTTVTRREAEAGLLADHVFDEEKLLGETDYFAREFVGGFAGLKLPGGWDAERKALAEEIASYPRVFMHRDFQSRNIMVKDGMLRIVDFQSAHLGPGMYDVASLLKDPYRPLNPGTRKTLLMELYYRFIGDGPEPEGRFEGFIDRFTTAGIQRNMQALAAYAFLGLKKGKTEFLEYIGPGLKLLNEGLAESGRFPVTSELAASLAEKNKGRKD